MAADMNEDREGPLPKERGEGRGFWWGVENPNQESAFALQASHSRMWPRAQEMWKGCEGRGGTRLGYSTE